MTLRIRKIIRPHLNQEPREHLAEGIPNDSIGHTETLLIVDAPRRRKIRFIEIFSAPIDKKLVEFSSEIAQQVTTGMSAVLFTQVRPPTDQIIIERFLKGITSKFGKSDRKDICANVIKVSIFIVYLGFAYMYERFDDSRLGIWKIVLIPIIVYIFYRVKNSFCGLRIYSRFREDTNKHINISNHPLTNLPWHEISQLGSTLFTGRFPYRVTLEELLHSQIGLLSRLKLFFRIPAERKSAMTAGSFSNAPKTMFTIQPAIIDSYKNVLAVVAIPDSNPESGILILPEPHNMDEMISAILNPKCETEQEKMSTPDQEQKNAQEQHDLNKILTDNFSELDDQISNAQELELKRIVSENEEFSSNFNDGLASVLRKFTDDSDLYQMYMLNRSGLTLEQVGDKVGCSASKVSRKLNKFEKENPGIRILRRKGGSTSVGDEYRHNGRLRRRKKG